MTVQTSGTLHHLPPLPVFIPTLTDAASRLLNQRDPTAKISVANCVTCKGRKTFRWFAIGSREDIVTYECPCKDQYLLYRWMLNCGIRKQYQRMSLQDLISMDEVTAAKVTDFLDNAEWYLDSGTGLILNGEKGNGKSMLSFLILKEMIAKGVTVYATTFKDMVDAFQDGWQDQEQARWFERTVRNAKVLYIDDLGREYKTREQQFVENVGRSDALAKTVSKDSRLNARLATATGINSVGERMLEAVIRSRVASDQTTLITTNLGKDEIEQGYGGHTMSLLTECSEIVTLSNTEDWRPKKAERDRMEIREHLTRPLVLS